ncbi:hypothetical protein QE152_g153 [Popillia japonica]|uniref:Uncharacterized protein n=1 Tax=Popillia japonica TaxID=7064 RepID=A0AAW1NKU5_POPJA
MKQLHYKISNGIRDYFYNNMDSNPLLNATVISDKRCTVLNLADRTAQIGSNQTIANLQENWSRKQLHGKHPNTLQQEHRDSDAHAPQWRQRNTSKDTMPWPK